MASDPKLPRFAGSIARLHEGGQSITVLQDPGVRNLFPWQHLKLVLHFVYELRLRRHGNAIVSAALTCMAEAFDGKPLTQGASIFGALIRLFANPREGLDPDKLVPALQGFNTVSLGEIIRAQEGDDARITAVYMTIFGTLSSLPFTSLTT